MQDSLYNIVFTVFHKYNICSKKGQEMYGYRKETVKNMLTKAPECAKISFADFKRLDAPLPQLDRGLGYEPRRRGFESLKARHEKRLFRRIVFFQLYLPSASYFATQLYSASPSVIVLHTV